MPRRGSLLAFEGIDGSGKSTQAGLLAAALKREGYQVVLTQEPTKGLTGQKLRRYLTGPVRSLSPTEELHLFILDRREHVEEVIKPALAEGKVVICDRYYYSTVAYQGALGLDPGAILAENESFAPPADLVFILTLPVPMALKRLTGKGREGLQLSESPHYLEQVGAIYGALAGPQFRHVDTSVLHPEAAHAIILRETMQELERVGAGQ